MDTERDRKRKKDNHRDDIDSGMKKKTRKPRSRSRSPDNRREENRREIRRKRNYSRSKSPVRSLKQEKPNVHPPKVGESKSKVQERKNKETDMLNTRTGGAYIPPARLRMMQAQITDKSSIAYQRLAWEALKKSIHGHINKINVGNIGIIIKELLRENIVRGRGLLSRSVIQAQAASPTFTNVYAALVAAVNSRFPNIGELLLKRLVIQFKRGFKRNDKPICISSASFIAHLVNQRVAHEILALELLTLLVESPTDDSVEVAIAFLKECGQKLTEVSSKGVNAIFEMLRNILHEGQLDKRVQYMIEVMFQIWKDGFKDHPALIEGLELVPEEEQFTHLLMLDDATDAQDILNVFKFDDKYEENEQKYKNLSKEILGSDAESDNEDGSGSESGSGESEDEAEEGEEKPMTIIDNTETNLIALRRTIYLTINSSLDFEECAHKLMKMQLKPGQEVELCHMFLDCCAEQRTYEKFYGLLAQRFCNINRIYISPFEEIFKDSYSTAHRLDTNRLRNVSKFFAHLLFTDSISWEVLECVKLNEEDTTSSSRIYIKILFQELAEYMGLKKLNDRLKDQTLQGAFSGVFPRDNPKNTRFSINFFTSIGLGGLTDELREHLKQMPKNVPPAITEIKVASDSSSSSSDTSSSSSSSDSSDSENEELNKEKTKDNSKKKKDKSTKLSEKEPETTKDKEERWGHDGFYETYGKEARRTESGPPKNKRDKDKFAIPRDPREHNRMEKSARDNDRSERDGDERRRHENDDSRFRRRETEREEDTDRRRDKRGDEYEPSKRRDSEVNRCKDKRIEDDSRSKRREADRGDEERTNRKITDDDSSMSTRREFERENDKRTDRRNRNNDQESRSRRRDYETNDADSRSKSRDFEREHDQKTDKRNREDDDSRSKRRDYNRENERKNDRRNGEDDFQSKRKEQDRVDKRKESNRIHDEDVQSRKDTDKEFKRVRDRRNENNERDDVRERRRDDEREPEVGERRKNKTATIDSEDNSTTSKMKSKFKGAETDEKKSKKKIKKKSKPSSDKEPSTSDSEEESNIKKKKKKSKKSKQENGWDIKNKRSLDKISKTWKRGYEQEKVDTEEWDIAGEQSIENEIPGRYWDRKEFQKQESRLSPEKSSKRRDR